MILTVALILDAIFGEPRWLWSRVTHPAVVMGRAVSALDRQLNDRTRRCGVLAVCVLVAGAAAIGCALTVLPPLMQAVAAAMLLAQKSLTQHVTAVASGLAQGLEPGRQAVAMIVGRDTAQLDEAAIARAAIESGAENLSDGVVAPAFWLLIAGLPGLMVYKAVNTADSMIGYRTEAYRNFGWAAARLDDLLNLVPARLTGAMIALASGGIAAWSIMRSDAPRHRSPNAGWPEAAMAATLGVRLSGPRHYAEGPSQDPWLNEGARDPNIEDVTKAVSVMWRVWWVLLTIAAMLWLL